MNRPNTPKAPRPSHRSGKTALSDTPAMVCPGRLSAKFSAIFHKTRTRPWAAVSLLAMLLLAGCATQAPMRNFADVAAVWTSLHPENATEQPLTARFSLQVETSERTGRLTGQIWGLASSLIRLDLASGAGSSVAMIRESPDLWVAYLPSENKAYRHARARAGLEIFNIPVPFDAREISALLTGDLAPILGGGYASVQELPQGRFRFVFRGGMTLFAEAGAGTDPLTIRGRDGWVLTCEQPYVLEQFPDRRLYRKYTFTSARDGRAVLRVKSLEQAAWRAEELTLHLPPETQWIEVTSPHHQ